MENARILKCLAIVFTRYMMLSVAQRRNEDDKTICELFFCLSDEMEDITFSQSMRIIIGAIIKYYNKLDVLCIIYYNFLKLLNPKHILFKNFYLFRTLNKLGHILRKGHKMLLSNTQYYPVIHK